MDLKKLSEGIKNLRYVVMRNWDKMPPDGDIDFFVHPDDLTALANACQEHLGEPHWYDIRTFGDNYYSSYLEGRLLEWCSQHSQIYFTNDSRVTDWKILSPELHFLTLYYHARVHKGDNRYDKKLFEIFWDWLSPPEPEDAEGVGYHKPDGVS